ncbi:MAG: metallophosphoesterase [Candidatus Hydrogenedentes bacterium]|nr:metallophosphoesterase [Candidatus Hydrogenedentota bacterium]
MRLSRRQFIGLIGAAGLAGCARTGLDKVAKMDVMPGGPGRLTFASIGDIHVLDARSTGIVNRAVDMINAREDVRFTVILGDLATDGQYVELNLAQTSLARLEKPRFTVPGNHDVNMRAKNIYGNYTKLFGDLDWRDEEEGWLFMGIDSTNDTKSDVSIRPDQLDWIEKQLEKTNKSRPIALMTHHPFNPQTKYRVINADEVLGMFAGHNLKLIAAGHFHGNQEEQSDGILFTTTACCSSTRDNHDGTTAKGFRLYHLDKDKVTTEFVEVVA